MNFLKIAADEHLIFWTFLLCFLWAKCQEDLVRKISLWLGQIIPAVCLASQVYMWGRESVCSGFLLSACAHKGVCVCTLVSTWRHHALYTFCLTCALTLVLQQPAPEPPAPVVKGPVPSEHKVLQDVFDSLLNACSQRAANAVSLRLLHPTLDIPLLTHTHTHTQRTNTQHTQHTQHTQRFLSTS